MNSGAIIEKLAESLGDHILAKKAEVTVAQLHVEHTPKLHPEASYVYGSTCYCPYDCRPRVINDVEHLVLRCSARVASRSLKFPNVTERLEMTAVDFAR